MALHPVNTGIIPESLGGDPGLTASPRKHGDYPNGQMGNGSAWHFTP